MILKLHSFSVPVEVDTDKIKAYVWSVELDKIELIIDGISKLLPVDEELYQLEEQYLKNKGK
jgi:hypothetical protein